MAKKSLASSMAAELQAAQPQTKVKPVKRATVKAPSRKGTKAIGGHFDPEIARQLKILAAETDKTNQSLLEEALNLLFEKYNKLPIA